MLLLFVIFKMSLNIPKQLHVYDSNVVGMQQQFWLDCFNVHALKNDRNILYTE